MQELYLSASEIAFAKGVSNMTIRAVQKRAKKENWPYIQEKCNGGICFKYKLSNLPEDIQRAYFDEYGNPSEENQKTSPRCDIPYNKIKESNRKVAESRSCLIAEYKRSGLSIQRFCELYNTGEIDSDVRENVSHITPKSFYRWKKFRNEGGLSALAPKWGNTGKGYGEKTLNDELKLELQLSFLTQNKWSISKCSRELFKTYPDLKDKVSYHTIYRYLRSLPPALVTYMREGKEKYRNKFEPYLERDYTLLKSMEWVVSDHHMLDLMVTDEKKKTIFRPWVTLFMDMRSRKPLGWHVDYIPSSLTILHALKMVIDQYGLFENLLIDHGKDYTAQILNGKNEWVKRRSEGICRDERIRIQGVFEELDVNVHFATPYRPQSKPIERFFGTIAGDFSVMYETYTGSNTTTRPEDAKRYFRKIGKLAKKDVILSLEDIRKDITRYFEWYSANWEHSGQGMNGRTPNEVFHENWKRKRIKSENNLELIFTRKLQREIGRNGIKIGDVWYYSPELFTYKGTKIIARRKIDNLEKIYVHDLEGRYICTANAEVFRGTGIIETDMKRTNSKIKKENAILHEAEVIKRSGKHRLSAVERAKLEKELEREKEYSVPENQEVIVVGGGVETPYKKERDEEGALILLTNTLSSSKRENKSKLKGLFD